MSKVIPNILMAAGAATAAGVAFFSNGIERGALFAGIVAAGVGYFWGKFQA